MRRADRRTRRRGRELPDAEQPADGVQRGGDVPWLRVAVAAAEAIAAARITGSARAGRLRLSFHVSTSDQEADLAADVLRRHVTSRHPATL